MSHGTYSTIGTISLVSTKFAYVTTEEGTVFCPLAAAVPPTEIVPGLRERYIVGNVVRLTAVRQQAKNGCAWRATKMRLVKSANDTADNIPIPESPITREVTITHVTDKDAFGSWDEKGSVFIPGTLFPAFPDRRLCNNIFEGYVVLVTMIPQILRNNCEWIATEIHEFQLENDTTVSSTSEMDFIPEDSTEEICGVASVISVKPTTAMLFDSASGRGLIKCSILSWTGGDGGFDVEKLDDFIVPGDRVWYRAERRRNVLRATEWRFPGTSSTGKVFDSYTQTALSLPELALVLLRPHINDILEQHEDVRAVFDALNIEELRNAI